MTAMTEDQVRSLLDLLAARGVVAWVAPPDHGDGVALLVEADGAESALALLVARGLTVAEADLPERIRLLHPRFGALELHPAQFDDEGNARRHLLDGGTRTIPAAAMVTDVYGSGRARQVRPTAP